MKTTSTLIKAEDVVILNGHLLSHQLTHYINAACEYIGEHGCKVIIVRDDGQPLDEKGDAFLGVFSPDTQSVALNLDGIYLKAVDTVMDTSKDACNLSLRGAVWYWSIRTVLHELFHARNYHRAGDKNKWIETDEEAEAIAFAEKSMIEMGKVHRIEPPTPKDDPYFGKRIMDFRNSLGTEDLSPATKDRETLQARLLDEAIVYYESEEFQLLTFREVLRSMSDDYDDDSVWGNPDAYEAIITPVKEKAPEVVIPVPPTPEVPAEPVVAMPDVPGIDHEALMEDEEEAFILPPEEEDYSEVPETTATPVQNAYSEPAVGYEPNGLTLAQTQTAIQAVCLRLATFIHDKCGYTGQPGAQFTTPGAIAEPIPISDIPGADKVFLHMDCLDDMGVWKPNVPVNGAIRGQLTKAGLPKYDLHLNALGHKIKRVIIPVNLSAGSSTAKKCIATGKKVAWFIDGNAPQGTNGIKAQLVQEPDQPWSWQKWQY